MKYSIMTVSLPIDEETYKEINEFCKRLSNTEKKPFDKLCNLSVARDYRTKGFYILAYDEMINKLIGVVSAFDYIGIHVYEWSIVIDPMYRETGIEESLLSVLSDSFIQREAEGEIVVLLESDYYGRKLIEQYGYTYNYSEAMFECDVERVEISNPVTIRPYNEKKDFESLIEIYQAAFGDMREESIELITLTTSSEGKALWIAELDDAVVGTVTTSKEGNNLWVTALAVHPSMRGKGIGTDLLKWVKNFAYQNGEKKVVLEVENENEHALSIYEKAGFYKRLQMDYFTYEG